MATSFPLKSPQVWDEAAEMPNLSCPPSCRRYCVQVTCSLGVCITATLLLVTTARLLLPLQTWSCIPPSVKLGKSTELRWKLQNRSAAGMRAIWLEICGEAILEFGWFTTRDQSSSMRMTEGGRLAVVRPASTRTRHSSASAKSRPFLQFFQEVRRITFFTSVKDGVMMLPFFRKSKGITAI